MSRAGLLRHWVELQTRTSAESGTTDATVSYATIAKIRCNVTNPTGAQFVGGRGSDRNPTHIVELRRVPDLSKANYMLVLNGPFKGIRLKIDDNRHDRLGQRISLAAYSIGEPGEFGQPITPQLPDIFT